MFGICRNTWRTLHALAVLILVTSAVLSSSTSTRAAAANDAISGSARADPDAATTWHNIAVQALASSPRPGQVTFLDIAVVQVAVHDAVQAIDRRFEPYHVHIPGASGSPQAAAAKAAHDVLVNILPSQAASLDWAYHNYFATHGLAENDPGVDAGAVAAAGILALRANDGRLPNPLPPHNIPWRIAHCSMAVGRPPETGPRSSA